MSCATVFVPGKSPLWATDFRPFTTLMYGNGPGYKKVNGSRPDLRNVDTSKAPSSRYGRDLSRNISSQRCVCNLLLQDGIKMLQNGDNEKTIPKKLNWVDL